jgi:hypothetical protein
MRFGVRSVELKGSEVVYTMAWTLCYGMQAEMRDAVEGALDVVTSLCEPRAT